MSEATKFSPSPRPMTSGGPLRAATSRSRLVAVKQARARRCPATCCAARPARPARVEPAWSALDEVRDDLGVGLRHETVALRLRAALELEVVLDDAVVDDDEPPLQSWCGWAFSSVGRPWVAQRVWPMPQCPVSGLAAPAPPRGSTSLPAQRRLSSCAAAHDGHAGRVVAAVLEAPEALHEDGDCITRSDVADDAAHAARLLARLGRQTIPGLGLALALLASDSRGARRAHPGFVTCRARPSASASAGTSSVMTMPAAT